MATPLYIPSELHDGPNVAQIMIPFVDVLPVVPTSNRALILSADVGISLAGLYVWDDVTWQFAMPIEAVSALIINGDTSELYIEVLTQQTLPANYVVYRNGQLQPNTVIDPGVGLVYSIRIPGSATSGVDSVNGMTGVVILNAANLPGLALVGKTNDYNDLDNLPAPYALPVATDAILGGVMVPVASNIKIDAQGNLTLDPSLIATINGKISTLTSVGVGSSLIANQGAGNVNMRSLVAGSNITISDDGNGGLVVASTGGISNVTLIGDVTGTGSGTVPTVLTSTGVVAGAYTKVTVDAKGRVTLGESPTTLAGLGVTETFLPLSGGSMSGVITMTTGSTVTGVPDPVNPLDAVNKQSLDAAIADAANGVSWRESVVAASTVNLPALSGLLTVDDVVLQAGDRMLVKNQTSVPQNGVYVVAAGAWTRATDMDIGSDVFRAAVLVVSGTVNGLTQWANTNTSAPTVGTDPITFGQLKGAANVYVAGAGLALSGLTFSIAPTGVAAGSYAKVTVNTLGQVLSGGTLLSSDITTALGYTPLNKAGDTMGGALNFATPAAVASAVTVAIGAAPANDVTITGTTSITAFDTINSGAHRKVTFSASLTLTHSAALSLPTATNIVTAAGDTAEFVSLGGGNWKCLWYQRASGQSLIGAPDPTKLPLAGGTLTGAVNFAAPVSVAAGASMDIAAAASNNVTVTGSASISTFASMAVAGAVRTLTFASTATLVHGSALILPGDANISVAAGDVASFLSLGLSGWRCIAYQRANGQALVGSSGSPFTTTQVFNGSTTEDAAKFVNVTEQVNVVSAAPTATTNLYTSDGSVRYNTINATAAWILNVSHSAGTTLNSVMDVGDSITVVHLATQGGTAFMPSSYRIDGVAVTPKWQGGFAPTNGNVNGVDAYSLTIIKTGSGLFTVLGAQTQFK